MTTYETQPHTGTFLTFPTGFTWGAATAAYQIEGAVSEDGRGPAIWDTFTHTPGKILGGDTGDVTVDHYHRVRDDVALMADLGLSAYRFSVAWPRIQPAGRGAANQAGLDFYRRLVDTLLERGIEPWLTLYHWDLPQALEDAGGWPARDTALRFADYALLVHSALGDRVRNWTTINEPWCAAYLGYASGEHAPGRREPDAAVRAAHHLLLGHGLATQAMRAARPGAGPASGAASGAADGRAADGGPSGAPGSVSAVDPAGGAGDRIGIALNLYAVSAATADPRDLDAARRVDGLQNRFFLEALLKGRYPEDVLNDVGNLPGVVHDGDLAVISTPIDLLGVNYYSRHTVSGDPDGPASASAAPTDSGSPWPGTENLSFVGTGRPVTGTNWEIDSSGLLETLQRVARDHPGVPLAITENGAAYADLRTPDGTVDDQDRLAYLGAHVRACHAAIEAGVPLRGYFVWSFMDNFEWAWGFSQRFGLVHVDYRTLERTLKASAHWYAEVIRRNGLTSGEGAE